MELLVVNSIIAIMAAILMPTIALVRESARKAVCGNNLRQMGMGALSYLQDWSALPVSQSWGQWRGGAQNGVSNYLSVEGTGGGNNARDVMKCPSDRRPQNNVGNPPTPTFMPYVWCSGSVDTLAWVWTSYTAGAIFSNQDSRNLAPATISAGTGMFWDGFDSAMMDKDGASGYNVHGKGVNMVFYDGHCSYLDMSPLPHLDFWVFFTWAGADFGYPPNFDPQHWVGPAYGVKWFTNPIGEPW